MSKEQGTIRLADRILAGARMGLFTTADDIESHHEKLILRERDIKSAIGKFPVIVGDNVAELFFDSPNDKYLDLRTDYPNMMPPFNECFVEYKLPQNSTVIAKEAGIFFQSMKVETPADALNALFTNRHKLTQERLDRIQVPLLQSWEAGNYDWVMVVRASVMMANCKSTYAMMGHASFAVSPHGEYMLQHFNFDAETGALGAEETINVMHNATVLMRPALLTFSFMNCKNVKVEQQEPNAKLSKAFQKRHGRPLLRYHTLEIEPMKQVLETEGGASHNGLKKALHICRGHFATYTPDKPLFGKFTGTVWKTAHVRGNASEGIVAKDYKVKAPKGGAA